MYIIQSEYYVSTKALKEIHEELVRQAKEGVMILQIERVHLGRQPQIEELMGGI